MKIRQQQQRPAFAALTATASIVTALLGVMILGIPSTTNAQTTQGPQGGVGGGGNDNSSSSSPFALTPQLLRLVEKTVLLSEYAYTNGTDPLPLLSNSDDNGDDAPANTNSNMVMHYRDEPDAALVTKIDGRCFGVFRGTDGDWADWRQNLNLGNSAACPHNRSGSSSSSGATASDNGCCTVQTGYFNAYFGPSYHQDFETALRVCVDSCATINNGQPCPVVLTGHSQGGAVAIVAAIVLADLDPVVITFGQPAVVDLPCDAIDHRNIFRFQNSRAGIFGPTYDPVPAVSARSRHIGHQIMLSDDDTGVAYIGLDSETTFSPYDVADGFATHRLSPVDVGYINQFQSLVLLHGSNKDNVRSNGFVAGTRCSEDLECVSDSCRRKQCQ